MSSWVKIGAKCICVRGWNGGAGWPALVVGNEYVVRETVTHPTTGELGVRLTGVHCDIWPAYGIERAWEATRFRPAVDIKDDIALFHALCPGLPVVPPAVVPKRVKDTSYSD